MGVSIQTDRRTLEEIPKAEKEKTLHIVNKFKATFFGDRVGKVDTEPIDLYFKPKYKPIQPPFRPPPLHYQDKLSEHLEYLRRNDIIEDVDPGRASIVS